MWLIPVWNLNNLIIQLHLLSQLWLLVFENVSVSSLKAQSVVSILSLGSKASEAAGNGAECSVRLFAYCLKKKILAGFI